MRCWLPFGLLAGLPTLLLGQQQDSSSLQLFLPDLNVQAQRDLSVPLTVANFKQVLTAQFSLGWDAAVLEFQDLRSPEFINSSHYFYQAGDSLSTINFAWDDPSLNGQSLSDGDTLLLLQFKAIGNNGDSSLIGLTDYPVATEFSDRWQNLIQVNENSGFIYLKQFVTLSGQVIDWKNQPLKGTEVCLNQNTCITADNQGNFSVIHAPGDSFQLAAQFHQELNPVNILDAILIRRSLEDGDPSQFITTVADFDQNDTVNLDDLQILKQAVIGNSEVLNDGYWSFNLDGSHSNQDRLDSLTYHHLENIVFKGYPVGKPSYGYNIDPLEEGPEITLEDYNFISNQEIRVPVRVSNFQNISGYQASIHWNMDHLALIDVVEGQTNILFKQELQTGSLHTCWEHSLGQSLSLADQSVLFELVFSKNGNYDSTQIIFSDRNNLFFNEDLQSLKAQLKGTTLVNKSEVTDIKFRFYLNYPNPVEDNVTISFDLPQAQPVKLTIVNSLGQQLFQTTRIFEAGKNVWPFYFSPKHYISGTYILKLEIKQQQYSQRMLILH
ncbi:MAG: cohesin domain-containing protein [Candidatus Cyclobacteriaceae bacterium M3_2C_046]